MGHPGERGEAEHHDGHHGRFAAAPPGGDAQEHQHQVDAPGEEGDGDLGLAIQLVFSSMKAQVVPAITASVMNTKPNAMDFEIRSSSVPSGGQPVIEFARLLGFELALLEQVEQGGARP